MKEKEEFYISLIGEAFDGYTEAVLNNQDVYIKHVSIKDQRYLHKFYEKYRQMALERGLETEEERINYVLKEGIWTEEDDQKIYILEKEIENLKSTVKSLFLPSQKEAMLQDIKSKGEELAKVKAKRSEVMGKTAEDYATSRSGDEILRFLLFKDKELTEHLYTDEQFGELEVWEIVKITELQMSVNERLTDARIQEGVLRPFFAMYLPLCENAADFYGKPIIELTSFQLRVALYGRMFHNIFQHTENIPDSIRQDPEKVLAYSEGQRNQNSGKSAIKQDADASMVFGATKSDMKTFQEPQGNKRLAEEAEKHGGQLNMEQMMRLAGHDV